jgi:hypothetical protein
LIAATFSVTAASCPSAAVRSATVPPRDHCSLPSAAWPFFRFCAAASSFPDSSLFGINALLASELIVAASAICAATMTCASAARRSSRSQSLRCWTLARMISSRIVGGGTGTILVLTTDDASTA